MASRNYSVDGFTKADMTGKLIIKVQLGDDIRCIAIHNEDITYDELILMMQRIYQGKLNNSDDIILKYKDEDGDLITIFDNSDLLFAIQCSKILKLTLLVNGQPKSLESDEVKEMKRELKDIRNRVNHLLDKLDKCDSNFSSPSHDPTSARSDNVEGRPSSTTQYQIGQNSVVPPLNTGSGKEFDPLALQKSSSQTSSSSIAQNRLPGSVDAGGQSYANRSGTPDSVNSLGSAALTDGSTRVTHAGSGGQTPQQMYAGGQVSTNHNAGQGQASTNHTQADGYMSQQRPAEYMSPQPPQNTYGVGQQQPPQQPQQLPQQQPRSAFTQPQAAGAGYTQQQLQPAYQQPQPVPTGYSQSQPPQTGYQQQPAGYAQQQPGSGYVQGSTPPGYPTSAYGQGVTPGAQQIQGGAGPPPPQGSNPYARGPAYGQYPRPQGQYPQQNS